MIPGQGVLSGKLLATDVDMTVLLQMNDLAAVQLDNLVLQRVNAQLRDQLDQPRNGKEEKVGKPEVKSTDG